MNHNNEEEVVLLLPLKRRRNLKFVKSCGVEKQDFTRNQAKVLVMKPTKATVVSWPENAIENEEAEGNIVIRIYSKEFKIPTTKFRDGSVELWKRDDNKLSEIVRFVGLVLAQQTDGAKRNALLSFLLDESKGDSSITLMIYQLYYFTPKCLQQCNLLVYKRRRGEQELRSVWNKSHDWPRTVFSYVLVFVFSKCMSMLYRQMSLVVDKKSQVLCTLCQLSEKVTPPMFCSTFGTKSVRRRYQNYPLSLDR